MFKFSTDNKPHIDGLYVRMSYGYRLAPSLFMRCFLFLISGVTDTDPCPPFGE